MNKKAQLPEWTMIFATLAVCIAVIYYSATFSAKAAGFVSIENVSALMGESQKQAFYASDALSDSVQKAYADTAKNPSGSVCGKLGSVVIWTDGCPKNSEIAGQFKKNVNNSLQAYSLNPSSISLAGGDVLASFEKDYATQEVNNILYYKFEYNQTINALEKSPDIDFEKIHSLALQKKTECDKRFETNAESDKNVKIARCLEEMRDGNWDAKASFSENYYMFSLSSKKSYFYDNSFKPVILSFALKI